VQHKATDYTFFLIIGGLLVFSLAFNILNATVIPVSVFAIAFSVILFLIIFALIFYNHITLLTTMGLVVAVVAFVVYRWEELLATIYYDTGIMAYLFNLLSFVRGNAPYDESYGPVITLLVCGFLALYVTLSLHVSFQFYFTIALGLSIFSVGWIMDYRRSDVSFLLFIFCFCVLLYKKMNIRKPDVNKMAIHVMPALLLIVVLAYFLPISSREWDNQGSIDIFRNPIESTNDFFYFLFNPKYFNFQSTGFGGHYGRLGGDLTLNDREVMRVRADQPIYLAGLIKDVYTGSSWINSAPDFSPLNNYNDVRIELYETASNFPIAYMAGFTNGRINPELMADLPNDFAADPLGEAVEFRELTINIGYARTGTLFRPMKNYGVIIHTDLDILANGKGDLRLSDVMPAHTEYSFEYIDIDFTHPVVLNILRSSYRGIYRDIAEASIHIDNVYSSFTQNYSGTFTLSGLTFYLREYLGTYFADGVVPPQKYIWSQWRDQYMENPGFLPHDPDFFLRSSLIPYSDRVYENFLGLPEDLPQRVRDLAFYLTSDAENDYDRIKAIEEYLRTFPYTLTPGMPPLDQDFVDYFLFEGQEGYCTYYASAMVVLSRVIGMPARYVEGFVMPPRPSADGYYYVTNLQAHAWPEVYFEGFGWVPFEPTAPYSFSFYQIEPAENTQIFSQDFAMDPRYGDYFDRRFGEIIIPPSNPTINSDIILESGSDVNSVFSIASAGAIVVLMLGCFVFTALKGKFVIWRRQARIACLPRNEQAIEYFRDIMKMTTFIEHPIGEHETPHAYGKRIDKRFAFMSDSVFICDLVNIYNKAKYANDEIHNEELDLMKGCQEELLDNIRRKNKKPVFFWNRYIARRI